MLEDLFSRFTQKDRLALSRLLTLAGDSEHAEAIRKALPRAENGAKVVAITGSGGVGKSTLIGRLIEVLRRRQKRSRADAVAA
jgi:putative protein kinase ArgK-like GTPase of G3E family